MLPRTTSAQWVHLSHKALLFRQRKVQSTVRIYLHTEPMLHTIAYLQSEI